MHSVEGAYSIGKMTASCAVIQNARGTANVAMYNTPAIVTDDEEAVEQAKGNRWNREEIHRPNGLPVVPKKGEPALGWIQVSEGSFHPSGNGSFGNIKTEHAQFSVDARRSPAGVLGHHLEDQISNLFRCLSSTHRLSNFRNDPPVDAFQGLFPMVFLQWENCRSKEHRALLRFDNFKSAGQERMVASLVNSDGNHLGIL